ncbi:hypothetical protein CPB84DRAFT_1783979, partial [Gymnopilus junonius]
MHLSLFPSLVDAPLCLLATSSALALTLWLSIEILNLGPHIQPHIQVLLFNYATYQTFASTSQAGIDRLHFV